MDAVEDRGIASKYEAAEREVRMWIGVDGRWGDGGGGVGGERR